MHITSSYLLSITTFFYLGAAAVYLLYWIFRVKNVGILATVITVAGFQVGSIMHIGI